MANTGRQRSRKERKRDTHAASPSFTILVTLSFLLFQPQTCPRPPLRHPPHFKPLDNPLPPHIPHHRKQHRYRLRRRRPPRAPLPRAHHPRSVLAVHDLPKGEAAKARLVEETGFAERVDVWELDMSDFASVVRIAEIRRSAG
ncbi:hypothetical protein R3P38DRAFT_3211929 [Favolaschia claudopus]|uniref:Uncharacterized protein n=1 Tax=Favolaschia claudopus TaxID=2862362 RepID=A0AAW0AEV9_9AGAR